MLLLRLVRPKTISAVEAGALVVVEGRVVARKLLKVLGTTVDCVFHDTAVEEFKSGVRGGRAMWTPMRSDQELEPFEVEDASGKILVWPEAERVDVRGGRADRIAARNGARSVTRYIAPGDIVRVRGVARVPPAPKKGKPRAALELGAPEGGKLVILFRKAAASGS